MTDPAAPGDGRKQSRRWWKIVLGAIVALIVIVVLGVTLFGRISVRRAFPDVDGEVAIAGLGAGVEVVRDDMGVAHIYADNQHDLFAAQGYVHAQERFWQMDVWRHIGSGRLSEMFGDSQVETDTFLRTMGWHDVATAQYAAAAPDDRAVMDAYAEGVNAYLASRSPAELSFEYTVLDLMNHSYDPEPWTPVDTLTWGITMAWDLRGNMDAEIERAMLLGSIAEAQVAQLSPPYPGDLNRTSSRRTSSSRAAPPPLRCTRSPAFGPPSHPCRTNSISSQRSERTTLGPASDRTRGACRGIAPTPACRSWPTIHTSRSRCRRSGIRTASTAPPCRATVRTTSPVSPSPVSPGSSSVTTRTSRGV